VAAWVLRESGINHGPMPLVSKDNHRSRQL